MMLGLRHVGIVVSDLNQAIGFYCSLLGFQQARKAYESGHSLDSMLALDGVKVTTVKLIGANGGMIELLKFDEPSDGISIPRGIHDFGISHIAITVQNLDKEYQRLKLCGVDFLSSPVHSGNAVVCFALDPDGNKVEIVQDVTFPRAA